MKLSFKAGTTSKLIDIFCQDSSSTTGQGLTGLVYNSGSLTAYYHRETDAAATAITLATMTVGTWATGGFKEISSTNMPGLYELGIPDAALASGAKWVIIMLKGATNMAPVVLEIELTTTDNQDSVRGGMTALPNAAAAATGGLATVDSSNAVKVQSGTSANQISLSSGLVTLAGVTHTGAVIPTVTTTTTATNLTNAPTSGDFTATMKTSITTAATAATPTATLSGDLTSTMKTSVTTAATAATPTVTLAAATHTGAVIPTVTNLTNAPTAGDLTATMKTSVTTAASASTPVATLSGDLTSTMKTSVATAVWDALTSGLTAASSIGKLIVDNLNATISSVYSRLGAPVGASISADIAAVQADTDNIQTRLPAALSGGKMDSVATVDTATIADDVIAGIGSLSEIAAVDIWTYSGSRTLTSTTPGASLETTTTGPALTMTRAVTYHTTITGLTIPTTWTKLYFTVKSNTGDTDSHSQIQIVISNPGSGSDGLLYINGGAAGDATLAALTVDRPGGNIDIDITDDGTSLLSSASGYSYDIKMITSASASTVLTIGSVTIGTAITLSVS